MKYILCFLKVLVGGEWRNGAHCKNVIAYRESQMRPSVPQSRLQKLDSPLQHNSMLANLRHVLFERGL
jgi:hypothetical protein